MGLFSSLDAADPNAVARAAAALHLVLERLPAPRSIAELRLDQSDVDWLWRWAAGMPATTANWSANQRALPDLAATRQQAFGVVFLALAAETARRDATEGRVWEPVRKRLSEAAVWSLFVQGQPRSPLKAALESACRRWQLRHVFGQEGQQAWYTSVYLQFGFTERTIEPRLPARLANAEALPTAVAQLLYDPRLGSAPFASLWNVLLGLRHRNVSEDRARRILLESPWILSGWTDALLKAAVARMDLTASAETAEDLPPSLFTVPRFEWNDEQPRFRVELVNLAEVSGELQPGAYRVRAGSVTAEFAIDDLGTPLGLQPLLLPLQPARITATVEQREAEDLWAPVAAEEILLWDPADEVAVFREDGFPIDAWSAALHPNQSYVLLLAPGLDVVPTQRQWVRADACLVVHVAAGWPEDLTVCLDGNKVWDPLIGSLTGTSLRGGSIPSTGTRLSEGPTIRLFGLSTPVAAIWADRQPVAFNQEGSSVDAFLSPPEGVVRPSVLVRTRDHTGATRSGRIPISWIGAQHLRPGGWVSFPVSSIDQRDLGQRIRAFTPDWREPALMLGNRPMGRVSDRGRNVGFFGAWGASLAVVDGRFNRDLERELTLVDVVTSHGVVQDVVTDDGFGGQALVILRSTLDRTEVRFIGIDRNGAIENLDPVPTGERSLALEVPPENALAIVYEDELIGSWWWRPPVQPRTALESVRLLALLRDAAAPLLSPTFEGWSRRALQIEPAGALAWLFDLRVGASFAAAPSPSEEFDPVARELLDSWEPDQVCVVELGQAVREVSEESIGRLVDVAQRFPVPAARLLISAFNDRQMRQRLRAPLLDALGWSDGSSADVLNEIGWQFDVAGGFLEHLGKVANDRNRGQVIHGIQRRNLQVAMNLTGDFRRWLAGRLISEG